MIIIQMAGGLGNQMFQYALYLKLKSMGKEVKFDDVETYLLNNARPIQLAVFQAEYPAATKEEIIEMTDGSLKLKDRIRRKLSGRQTKEYREAGFNYDPKVLEVDPAYLVGNFQSEKYFKDIEPLIRKTFRFVPEYFDDNMRAMQKNIDRVEAVSIHVRRGDYLAVEDVFGEICTDAYYDAAIQYVQKKRPNAIFYLFTNDLPWADFFVNARPDIDIIVVKGNTEYTGYLDMHLMKHCKHNIIANSTFSWWGSWLNENPDKLIVAPDKWLRDRDCGDIYTDEMTIIDAEGNIVREPVRG